METVKKNKQLHQQYSELDNKVFSAFCDSFKGVRWIADFKDNENLFCGIDLQLTAITSTKKRTYDVEIKSVHLNNFLPYCYFQADKWLSLVEFDNDVKLYVAIYPNHDKIVIWKVCRELFLKSEKELQTMKTNTCRNEETMTKLVYKFKLTDGKIFNFDLSQYKDEYNALYLQRREKAKAVNREETVKGEVI